MNRIQGQNFVVRGLIFLVGAIVVMLLTRSWWVAGLAAITGVASGVIGVRAMGQEDSERGESGSGVVKEHPLLAAALLAAGVAMIVAVLMWRVT